MTTPQGLPTLHAGAHKPGDGKACIMEYVALLAGEEWSDTPACTHRVLALVAQSVNDGLSDTNRHLLVPLIGRLFGTGIDDRADSLRVTVGLAMWAKDRAGGSAEYAAEYAEYAAEPAAKYAAKSAAKSAESAAKSAEYAAKSAAKSAAEEAAKSAAESAEYAAKSAEYAAEEAAKSAAESAEYAAKSAEYAAYAAKSAEYAEYAAEPAEPAAYAARRVGFLADLIDEYDRLTGRTAHRVISTPELTELAQLVTT